MTEKTKKKPAKKSCLEGAAPAKKKPPIKKPKDADNPIKQKAWVTHYVKTYNATRASLLIGVPHRSSRTFGCNMMKKATVLEMIQEFEDALEEDAIVTRSEVLHGLKLEAYQAFDSSDRIAAWGKLGKFLGMERLDIKLSGEVHLHFDDEDANA